MKKITLSFFLFISCTVVLAQTYGNEWINTNQKYFKIPVGKAGIYRIEYLSLIQSAIEMNLDLANVNPKKWQVFHNGKEIPIYVAGEQDNIFNNTDFIEFYAKLNDGSIDNELYNSSSDNANPKLSLFTDSSVYYLTFMAASNPQNGLRLKSYNNNNYGSFSPLNYCWYTSLLAFNNRYSNGKSFVLDGSESQNPEYLRTEGLVSTIFGSGTSQPFFQTTLTTPSHYPSGPNSVLNFRSVGLNDNNFNTLDHHLKVEVSSDNIIFNTVLDTLFDGFQVLDKTLGIPSINIGNNTIVKFSPQFVNGVAYQAHAIGFVQMRYPRNFNFIGENQINFQLETFATPQLLNWQNYPTINNKPILYDLINGYRIRADKYTSTDVRVIVPANNGLTDYYLTDSSNIVRLKSSDIQPAISQDFNDNQLLAFAPQNFINKHDFLMLTNNKFVGYYTGQYLSYKSTKTNTGKPGLVTVQQLYNQFSYGVPHPIAIRRFIKYLVENGDTTLKHLFIVGRGYQNDLVRLSGKLNENLVPAIGVPASDNLFATDINGSGLSPVISIGRLTIDKAYQLGIYLNKVKEYDASASEFWRKHMLHLAGGKTSQEALSFTNRLNNHANFVRSLPFGGKVTTFTKSSIGINEPFLKQKAIDIISKPEDNGVEFVTFLGHGSSSVSDVDIGDTAEYYNRGKYPIFYFNGCNIGNPCVGPPNRNTRLAGELFINASNKGSIAFIAQTSLSELSHVDRQIRELYRLIFSTKYNGQYTIGEAVKDMLRVTGGNLSDLSRTQTRILFLQGDPSLSVYQPQEPDYAIDAKTIFPYPANFNAVADSFALAIPISNIGRYVSDSLSISISRSYPNSFIEKTYTYKVKAIAHLDTVYLYMKSKDAASAGINRFTVSVNYDQSISEETILTNNTVTLEKFIPGNGVNLIYPKRFDIVSKLNNDTVTLVAQALNIFESNYQFVFEIDTSYLFNSPWLKKDSSSSIIGHLRDWKVKLLNHKDSIVYYWRARINTGSIQGGLWSDRSFVHIFDNSPGWSQSHFPQFYPSSSLNRIELNKSTRKFEFSQMAEKLYINTAINKFPNFGIKKGGYNSSSLNPGTNAGILAILFDQNNLEQFRLNKIFNTTKFYYDGVNYDFFEKLVKAYNFWDGSATQMAQFHEFVDSIPEGTYVGLCTVEGTGRSSWSEETIDAFRKLGSSEVDSNFSTFAMIGKKGAPQGWASETRGFYQSSPVVVDLSYIEVEKELLGKRKQGSLKSEIIGPTTQWDWLHFWTSTEDSKLGDDFYIDVHAIANDGNDTVIFSNIVSSPVNLSSIDAKRFQNIYLEGHFWDDKNYTPSQIMHWRISNAEVPEGTLNPTLSNMPWRDTLQQGETFTYELAFQNISKLSFDKNLKYEVYVFNIDTKDTIYKNIDFHKDSLLPNKFFKMGANLNTKQMKGRYAFFVKVNFNQFSRSLQPELTLINNSAIRYFFVEEDLINPLLDVTFDGKHITNGEIVSANPIITISSKDENKLNWQTDTAGIMIWLKKPNESVFQRIDFDSFGVKFFPATSKENLAKAEFEPKNLPDGIYTLKVQSKDANSTLAGTTEYLINFVVINEASTTNFYPYPNPFTSSMRFVFTLTGSEVPDYINIKIMTIQGKVVKEINKDDLGTLRIGNNITDVIWDGTDEFGDRLSNGVYLYTVTIKTNGKELTQLENDNTSDLLNSDKANNKLFKHSFGKVVLLR
ncbi:MAG: C25 family cysteine peptidase [Bacteroidota bacterium]|nr:C25 family cysteine peptidase [Bacteroidota bacterium]